MHWFKHLFINICWIFDIKSSRLICQILNAFSEIFIMLAQSLATELNACCCLTRQHVDTDIRARLRSLVPCSCQLWRKGGVLNMLLILADNGYGYGMIVVNRRGQQLPYMRLEALARFMLAKLMIAWLSARQA